MQPLDLYASIEQELDFKEEVESLHNNILGLVEIIAPKTLIDIGCGQGDFCLKAKKSGINSFGVDLSKKQIQIAKTKGVNAKAVDIKDIIEKYECATAIFDVLNYLPKAYIEEFIKHTYNLLEEDGYFIFDVNTLFGFEDVAQGTLVIDIENKFISIDANFEKNILYTDITLFTKEKDCYKKDSGTIEQFYYSKNDLRTILERVGFNIENIVNFNLHNFDEDDKYIFICKK